MEISDVRVRLVKESTDRLKAVCSVTMDGEFVVRDVKIVEGTHGLFVAMPSRKLSSPCPKCKTQNQLRAKYCNECGSKLPPPRIPADADGREKAHRDIAHPITATFRKTIQDRVLESYRLECEKDEDAEVTENVGYSGPAAEANVGTEEALGEYDALIADLNDSGSHEALHDERVGSGDSRRHEVPREAPVGEADRDQQRGRRGRRHRRGRGDRRTGEAAGGQRAPVPSTPGAKERESFAEGMGDGRPVERERERDVTTPAERRVESFGGGLSLGAESGSQPEPGENRDEESSFGAGLV